MKWTDAPAEMLRHDETLDTIIAAMTARDDARALFIEANQGRSFRGLPRSASWTDIIISPCTSRRGKWRVTRCDVRGPTGHTEAETYADAVKTADVDYGVALSEVEFA